MSGLNLYRVSVSFVHFEKGIVAVSEDDAVKQMYELTQDCFTPEILDYEVEKLAIDGI
jgi:hypothetical protein